MVCACAALSLSAVPAWSAGFATPAPLSDASLSTASQIDPRAEKLLREMSRNLSSTQRLQATAHAVSRMEMHGMLQEMSTTYSIAVERPDKLAVRSDSSFLGSTIVTDGTTLTRYNVSQKTYKSEPAPPDLQPTLEGSAGGIGGILRDPMAFIGELLGKTPYEAVMQGVTAVKDLGTETVNGSSAEHLQLSQEDQQWDLWLSSGDKPLPVRASIDLTAVMVADASQRKDRRFTGEISFLGWNLSPAFGANEFAFVPPDEAKPASEPAARVEPSRQLLTKPAPNFKLPLLGGGEVDLAALKGKVVVLDFWATWCGPCRMALPVVSSTTMECTSRGVEFFAVNLREDEEEIRDFLKQAKLNFPVALDKTAQVADLYKVEGIPQTVLIGKDGTVQVVHVGFSPDMKPELRKELDDLIAGKTLATTPTETAQSAPAQPGGAPEKDSRSTPDVKKTESAPDATTSRGVQLAWKLEGTWAAVATDTTASMVYAANLKGEAAQLSGEGRVLSQFKAPDSATMLRTYSHSGKTQFLGFQSWGRTLTLFDKSGKEQWSAPLGQGISDVAVADLDNDGIPEILVAANSSPGVLALKADSTSLWKADKLVKATHVDSCRDVDGSLHILATSSDGKIHDLTSTGSEVRKVDAKIFASLVRATAGTSGPLLLVAGTTKNGEGMAAVELDGHRTWTTPLTTNPRAIIDNAVLSPDGSKVAVSIRGSAVHVLDVSSGRVLATVAATGLRPELAWLANPELLIIATGTGLEAVRLSPAN
jgi:peroxiredoxin